MAFKVIIGQAAFLTEGQMQKSHAVETNKQQVVAIATNTSRKKSRRM
jgi:hypothetical protein